MRINRYGKKWDRRPLFAEPSHQLVPSILLSEEREELLMIIRHHFCRLIVVSALMLVGCVPEPALVSDRAGVTPDSLSSSTPAKPEAVFVVEGEGLRLFDPQTTSAAPIAFGRASDEVITTLERLRGPAGRGTNQDCGAGPVQYASWPDGLSLVFQQDRFVGWGLDGRATGAISTANGIGPGSTREALEAAYGDVNIGDSSLGVEFSAGGLSGVIDGPNASSRITDIWAGVSCVAR